MCLPCYRTVSLQGSEHSEYALQLVPLLPWLHFVLGPSTELTTRSSHIAIAHPGCSLYILIFGLSLIHVGLSTPRCRVLNTCCTSQLPVRIHGGSLSTLPYSLVSCWTSPARRLVHLQALGEEANLIGLSGSLFGHLILIMHVRLNLNCNKSSL